MTRFYSLGGVFVGGHLSTISPFHGFIVAPIYYEGVAIICITLSGVGLPAVILNPVRDDLRMMAPKPVAAKDGGMKDIAECIGLFMRLSNK
jgi:expansin (peptidoglycan-binding protein)